MSLCASRVTFGDSTAPTDLLKLMKTASLPSKRKLQDLVQTNNKVEQVEERIHDLTNNIKRSAALLDSLLV